MSLSFYLFLLQVAMVGVFAYRGLRDRRPYQLVFLFFWALLLFASCTDRIEEFALLILPLLVGGVILQRRDRFRMRRAMERWARDFAPPPPEKKQPRAPDARGLYDRELDGPRPTRPG